jgi:hypothetical protein
MDVEIETLASLETLKPVLPLRNFVPEMRREPPSVIRGLRVTSKEPLADEPPRSLCDGLLCDDGNTHGTVEAAMLRVSEPLPMCLRLRRPRSSTGSTTSSSTLTRTRGDPRRAPQSSREDRGGVGSMDATQRSGPRFRQRRAERGEPTGDVTDTQLRAELRVTLDTYSGAAQQGRRSLARAPQRLSGN